MRFNKWFPWVALSLIITVGVMIWRQAVVVSEVETRWQEVYSAQEEQMRQANDLIRAANSRIADSNSVIKELDDRVSQQNQTIAAQRDTIDLLSTPAPTYTPRPTYTRYPTATPRPTYTPQPTYTRYPTVHRCQPVRPHGRLTLPTVPLPLLFGISRPAAPLLAPPHSLALGKGQHLRGH